ncbi:MAG: hypothetical protein LJE94_13765 [Deltaproteobacteria bacterium]|nr:hypothetical protein [Deltaproteobacteria bacterium]
MSRIQEDGILKPVMMAYLVLALHLVLIVVLGLVVIFFSGIIQYVLWIFLFGAAAILASFYYFYRRMKAEGRSLRRMMASPLFNGRPVEVSLLGGMASFKLGGGDGTPALGSDTHRSRQQLEDPDSVRLREIKELAYLLKNDLITREEYEIAKQQLFNFK